MSLSSRDKDFSKYLGLGRAWLGGFFEKYLRFGGETTFNKSVGVGLISLAVTVVGFRSLLNSPNISESGLSILSIISIPLLLIGTIYFTTRAARRTNVSDLHTRGGQSKVIATYLLLGVILVLLLRAIQTLVLSNVHFLELSWADIMFGTGLTLLFTLAAAWQNYSALSEKYPSLKEVLTTFSEESSEKLDRIDNQIEGIGHVPRSETNRIVESLQDTDDLDNTIVKGRGGVGKSGILKQVCEECNHEILFIDASAYPTISSEPELTDELDLDISLERSVQQVAANRSTVVMFDQLDDTDRESGAVYSNIITSVAKMNNVGTIFACRTYELENYDEFNTLSGSGHFDNEIEVTTLTETQVEEHLEELGVTSPSQNLIELCEEIEYLDVIGRLIDEGTDLEDITQQVTVWEEYRKLLAEDHPSDDQLRGSRVVDRAVEHAIETTESGKSVFSVNEIRWTDEQLISSGAVQRVRESDRDRLFRFRHRQFQLYLYAWGKVNSTVDDENLFRDVIDELDENINTDVVKWMFAIYTDRETDLPDDTDDFLDDILDEDGFGFYWASKIVDVVKKWDASENPEITETVLEKLEDREDLYKYFFDENTDSSWTQALARTGRFQDPPRHLLGYLHDIASLHPELVSTIIRENLEDLNRNEKAVVVSILQELPLEYSADLYETVKEELDESDPRLDMYYSRSAEFTEDLIDAEYYDEGLELINSLLTVRLEADAEGRNDEIMGSYYLTSLFEDETLERLVQNRPSQAIELFEDKLRDAIRDRAGERNRDIDQLSFFYHHAVSSFCIAKDDRNKPFELFVGFLREALDIWSTSSAPEDQEEKIEEYLTDNVIFRGFGFYLLREYSDEHRDIVAQELLREKNYGDTRLKKEFNLLLKHGFGSLSEQQQREVIEVINSVPIRETFEQIAEDKQDEFEDMTYQELLDTYTSRWIRDRLWPIRDHLPEDTSERLSELVDRFEDEPEDPETPAIRGGFVSHESPESRPVLESRPPSELIDFCIEEPFEEQEWYETDSVQEIGRTGAAEQIASIIVDNPERYASEIPRLSEAPDEYSIRLLGNIQDRMEDEPEIIESQPFREAIWELSDDIASNPDEWSTPARKRIGWLIRDGLGDENLYSYFLEDDIEVKDLIFTLVGDPDPDVGRDRPPEGYAGHNNPSHTALNTVRPVAVDALIVYTRRKSDKEDSGLDPQIFEKLEEKLEDPSLGVHSIFGRRLPTLWPIDTDWVIDHLPDIFPRSQTRNDIEKFTAAWDSYVAFNPAYSDVFPELRRYYFHAIDLMAEGETTETVNADQGMVGHLLANYLYEYELEDWSESLLAYLYDRGEPDLARQVAWSLWKWGDNQEEDDVYDNWDKIRSLWERRLVQVGDDETYSEEITWFVRNLEHVEERVELPEVEHLLQGSIPHIGNNQRSRRAWTRLEEYLAKQSNSHTETAVNLFHSLVTEYERPFGDEFNDDVADIIRPAFEEYAPGNQIYDNAFEIAETYASEGDSQAEAFLDEYH